MKTGKELFNAWAANYDQLLDGGNASISFEGYQDVLAETVIQARVVPGMRVLDLGTGTGNLAARFVSAGCDVWGMDYSENMLAKAREKLPSLQPVLADLRDETWPQSLMRHYDRIVSAYVWHDFDLDAKMGLLKRLIGNYMASRGRVVIADIAYPDRMARTQARAYWGSLWSEAEYYWAGDETIAACKAIGLACTYQQVSSCAGVFVIETAQQREDENREPFNKQEGEMRI
ncbi:MAG: class I SAM-dependent methyltransferase [Anaerolineales bacterium]|jgi:cyclopropane fatty-acyl-phospholipid synthase-like methyltransferase